MCNITHPPLNDGGGNGNGDTLLKRAKRKATGYVLALGLSQVAESLGDEVWRERYTNFLNCANTMQYDGYRERTNYCKHRFCPVCNSIRKAALVRSYGPVIDSWEDAHYLVLTTKAVRRDELTARIEKTLKTFRKIKDKHRKRAQRGKGTKLVGLYALECNFNTNRKTYNPHLNLILQDGAMADTVKAEWMSRWGGLPLVSPKSQHLRRIKTKGDKRIMEVFKYITKFLGGTKNQTKDTTIHFSALHHIFKAIHGKQTFKRFGFDILMATSPYIQQNFGTRPDYYEYHPDIFDWSDGHGNYLSGYQIPDELLNILDKAENIMLPASLEG